MRDHNAQCVVIAVSSLRQHLDKRDHPVIVIDRPHTQLWEMQPLVALARKRRCQVFIHEVDTAWAKDWRECSKRTRTKVSPALLSRMAAEYEAGATTRKVLASKTPLQKLERCEDLWNRMQRQSGVERQAAYDPD